MHRDVVHLELVFQRVVKISQNAGMRMKDFGEGMLLLPLLPLDVAHQAHLQTQIHLFQSTLHPHQLPDHYSEIHLVAQYPTGHGVDVSILLTASCA